MRSREGRNSPKAEALVDRNLLRRACVRKQWTEDRQSLHENLKNEKSDSLRSRDHVVFAFRSAVTVYQHCCPLLVFYYNHKC